MRLGMNVQRLEGQRLGVGRYLEYLIRYWSTMLAPSEEVVLFCREPLREEQRHYLKLTPAFRLRHLQPRLTGFLWENLVLGPRRGDVDVLFGPSYTLPMTYRGRSVVAIHSANELQAGAHSWWHNHTYVTAYRLSARKADRVIVPSESTKKDVRARYGIPADRIVVVPQGADEPYVLFVGKLSQRRNIPMLIEAFAALKKRRQLPHKLVLFGPNHLHIPLAELTRSLGVEGSVVQTDGVVSDHRDLVPIYSAADLFVHPSSYEGWSMTTMEALACGTAVVAANRGGLGEVANGHALMVDEPSVDSLADAIESVLLDPSLRQELRAKARARGSAIRWEHTTRQTLDVLREVAAA